MKPSKNSANASQAKPQILKAVTIIKTSDLQARVFEITLVDGKLTETKALDRGAGDLLQMQISRAEEKLWEIAREENKGIADQFKDL